MTMTGVHTSFGQRYSANGHQPCGSAGPAVLTAGDLAVGYRQRRRRHTVLDGLDLSLRAGELTCLLGSNGSGKTTLLRTLAGSLPPLAGRVHIGQLELTGMSPADRARHLAVVLTGGVDSGLLRAVDLVALGRHPYTGWSGRLSAQDHAAVTWALEATGASALANRQVPELSDGERQRVMIARALAQEPQVLLLDEPTAFVDLPRRLELAELLTHLARDCGLAILLTSHDLDLALRASDHVWLLDPPRGPAQTGTVVTGAPEDLALSGALARAFDTERVHYDRERGRFITDRRPEGRVAVVGEGVAVGWAVHAVERAGYQPVDAADDGLRVAVGDGPTWWLDGPGGQRAHSTLGSLVDDLRQRGEREGDRPAADPQG